MKKTYALIICVLSLIGSISSYGQYAMKAGKHPIEPINSPMTGGVRNYKTFTAKTVDRSDEVLAANKAYINHPEIGTLYEGAPDADCYELIGERTEINKTFVKKGSNGKDLYVQTSTAPMHYKDAAGNWITIKTRLEPDMNHKGVYAAYQQPAPICINAANSFVSIGKAGKNFQYNNNLELVYQKTDGTEVSLGSANWAQHTAGDEGIYVTNAWEGVDIEIYTIRGAIKTNFLIRHALPQYADGKLLVRDHLQMDKGLTLYASGQTKFAGNMEIRDEKGEKIYDIGSASAFEKGNIKTTFQALDYLINGNVLDIALPGNFLNRDESAYPVVIDPLVTLATNSVVNGSTYSTDWTVPCVYTNLATVPANITITDIQFAFTYSTGGTAWLYNGATDFRLAGCRSPTGVTGIGGSYWYCNTFAPGSCIGSGGALYSIYPDIAACVPPPQCPSYNLNITMDFYQDWLPTAPCATTYIFASTPLTITVIGHTVEFVSATASATTICPGASSTLTGLGDYGVPPYTYSWTPGPLLGSPVVVTPGVTTTYTLLITDACGITATGTRTITVSVVAPITGIPTVCVGNTTNLADATGGAHTWTSSNNAIATVSGTGVVTGVSAGTVTITYTVTATGCTATIVVTVTPPPVAITGGTTLCVGSTSVLADATAGGTWSSSNPGVATVSGTGLVTGVAIGTATITYTLGGSCYATILVTVTTPSVITGVTSICGVGNTTLLSDATAGGVWSSSNTAIATISTTGLVTAVAPGTVTITYTTGAGCTVTTTVTVYAISPITGVLAVCVGGTTALSDLATPGTWTSSNTAIATVSPTGIVTGVAAGTVTITFTTTAGGCTATATIVVSNVAPITGIMSACVGNTSLLGDITAGGTWSSSNTAIATVSTTGLVTGVSAGTVTITYTTGTGCFSTATFTVNASAPITGVPAVCVGSTTALSDAGAGTWSSSNVAVATVSGTGVVTGVAAGTATITFTNAVGGCTATMLVTVSDVAAIAGTTTICSGQTVTLTDATAGGAWTSSNPAIASIITSTGVLTGVAGGTCTITYTTAAGCTATILITVSGIAPIVGTLSACVGGTSNLTDAAGAGTWSSSNTAIATIGASTGIVNALSAGSVTITFTSATGCSAFATFVVNGIPNITGTESVCAGSTTALSCVIGGGTWSCTGTAFATINAATGVVTGVSAGTATVTYATPAGCTTTTDVTVNPLPAPITGPGSICQGFTATLADVTIGGSWLSSNTATATIDAGGVVTGIAGGTVTISYTSVSGCINTAPFIVNGTPPAITGAAFVCAGATINLSDALTGGTWTSDNTAIATIDPATAVVTGVSAGTATITYTSTFGCFITTLITVRPLPAAITGKAAICEGESTYLSDSMNGGAWDAVTTTVATIDASTGLVTGIAAGNTTIIYTVMGCSATLILTVNPIPPAITGMASICVGAVETLADAIPGGTWNSSDGTIATVNATTGVITGVKNGTSIISYTSPAGCLITGIITINVAPAISFFVKPDICIGDTTKIELTSASTGIISYTWDFGDAQIISSSSNSFGPFFVSYPIAGTYYVTVTANASVVCPSLTVQDTVKIHNFPNASIQPIIALNSKSNGICTNDSILLRAVDGDVTNSFYWTPLHFFEQNNIENVIGKIEVAGFVTLQVTDPFGCSASDSVFINAQPCCQVTMPDAFSPNGDGLNDVFRPISLGTHGIHIFRVVNRWGQCVYESEDAKMGWNGIFNGVPQDIGVYYYYLSYDCDGRTVIEKGEVTLIR